MAYTRWISGDLYIFQHMDGYICCLECPLKEADTDGWRGDWESSKTDNKYNDAIEHIQLHVKAGHTCHPDTVPRLIQDQREEQRNLKMNQKRN